MSIEPGFLFLWAMLLLILPLNWLVAVFFAAAVHELCHLTAVILLGGHVIRFRLSICGAEIRAQLQGRWRSMAATLAGPVGSLLLMTLCRQLPRVAVCGCIQGLYNLLPFDPLDGSRILWELLTMWCPEGAERIYRWISNSVAVFLLLAAIFAAVKYSMGLWPVLLIMVPISNRIKRNIPCK